MPRARWTLISVIATIVLLLFAITILLPTMNRLRQRGGTSRCASNLHQIGLAIILYQNDNNQSYPCTIFDRSPDPIPTWGSPYSRVPTLGPLSPDPSPFAGPAMPDANDVTASLFLLIRNEKLKSIVFIDPATEQDEWDFGGGSNSGRSWTNWSPDAIKKHLSYSFLNEFPSKSAIAAEFQIKDPDATFAVASDMNPGGPAVTTVTVTSQNAVMRTANSLNHDQDGQYVLYGDGHAEWQNNPFCGKDHDNIFTAAGPEISEPGRGKAAILKAPVSPSDSVLLPTAADLADHK